MWVEAGAAPNCPGRCTLPRDMLNKSSKKVFDEAVKMLISQNLDPGRNTPFKIFSEMNRVDYTKHFCPLQWEQKPSRLGIHLSYQLN